MPRVLSIQSHVVSGYVGNRAATFPLQTLGFDVDVINTVQYSNHTGYGYTNGHKTTPEQLANIFEGLRTNGLVEYDLVLTGYIPGAEALQMVANNIPKAIYVLDPVMGDIGTGLYVSPDVIPIYKEMLKQATIITPNQFEVELLSGVTVDSTSTLFSALSILHESVQHVAFSSIPLPVSLVSQWDLPPPPLEYQKLLPDPLPPWYTAALAPSDDILVCFASSKTDQGLETWAFALPTIDGYFSGVGDLFSAMVLAHYQGNLSHAVGRALLLVQQILLKTHLHSLPSSDGTATPRPLHHSVPTDSELDAVIPANPKDPKRKAKRMRIRELRVIPERKLLETPGVWPGRKLDCIIASDTTSPLHPF